METVLINLWLVSMPYIMGMLISLSLLFASKFILPKAAFKHLHPEYRKQGTTVIIAGWVLLGVIGIITSPLNKPVNSMEDTPVIIYEAQPIPQLEDKSKFSPSAPIDLSVPTPFDEAVQRSIERLQ